VRFEAVAGIAKEYVVPVLMHFQHEAYNLGFERYYKMLEKYSTVDFIGNAQTWWGNIDKSHQQTVMYPKGAVTPGGITDDSFRPMGMSTAISRPVPA
jgi:hypothetical protein